MLLDLSHNRLLRLEDSTFSSMPRLAQLELSHNTEMSLEPRGRSFIGLDDTLNYLGLRNISLSSVSTTGSLVFVHSIDFIKVTDRLTTILTLGKLFKSQTSVGF